MKRKSGCVIRAKAEKKEVLYKIIYAGKKRREGKSVWSDNSFHSTFDSSIFLSSILMPLEYGVSE